MPIVKSERIAHVLQSDAPHLALSLASVRQCREPFTTNVDVALRDPFVAGKALGAMIADEILRGECKHRPRIGDRATGDDGHRSPLIELYKLLLHVVRDACVPRSQDDWGERAIDVECQQYLAADEVADLRQRGAR